MKTIYKLLLIGFITGINVVNAQNRIMHKPESVIRKNSVSANILGTGSYVGISYERLLFQRVIAEVGIGVIGYGIGVTVYPIKKVKAGQFNPFIGLKFTDHAIVDGENKSATYLPIGVTYFSKNSVNFSVDIGPSSFYHKSPGYNPTQDELDKYPFSDFGVWGNLKIGYRF